MFKYLRRLIGITVCLLAFNQLQASSDADYDFIFGADVSALTVHEEKGSVYKHENGEPDDCIAILKQSGMNCMRLRLFIDPNNEGVVTNDLDYTLKLAKRIKAQGLSFLLDIHYSDTWADPSHQIMPVSWEGLQREALYGKIEQYTQVVLERFIEEGVSPEFVQLGNEITNGLLWPEGKVEFSEPDVAAWDRLGRMLKAANRGLVNAYKDLELPVNILHIESTGNLPRTQWYLEQMMQRGLHYDVIGFSYYPQWHGTYEDLQQTLDLAANITGSDVMVVETACPWKETSDWSEVTQLPRPFSPENQKLFLQRIIQVVRTVPSGKGRGVFWWYPEAILTGDLHVWLGGDCALFDNEGCVLPAASAIK
jgi:arabinogalactan endo-1,4-beta-galactosidase